MKSSIGNIWPAVRFRGIGLLVLILSAAVLVTRVVRADDPCQPVHGTINSLFTTQNCTSPVGLCTGGNITGGGRLDGPTTFVAEAVAPSAGLSPIEPAANLSYSGQLTIVTTGGTLVTHDLGVLDGTHLSFTEMERPASGTGISPTPVRPFSSFPVPSREWTGIPGTALRNSLCLGGLKSIPISRDRSPVAF